MRRALAILCCLLALPAWGGDWRDTLTPLQPGKFPPPRPLKATYQFGWSGVTAAMADFDFSKNQSGQFRLAVNAKTVGAVRALWRLDAQHSAVCDAATLRPMSLQQTEIYKSKTESAKAVFFPTYVERQTQVTPASGPPPKNHPFKFGDVFDLQTALFFIRSQRLEAGDRYRMIVYPSKAAYFAEVEVLGREKLNVAGRSVDAIKCRLRLQGMTKKLELEPYQKFKRAFAWLSDDRDRLLLKAQADIFVGSVWCEMQSAQFTSP